MICASLVLLQIMFAVHRWRSGGNGPSGRGLWIALTGNVYKVSVTGFTFGVIGLDWHYDDEPP